MNSLKNNRIPLVILMVNMFIAMLGIGLIIPVLPIFVKEFGVDGTAMGYLIAIFALTQFLFSPFAGEFSDKFGRKKPIIIGLVGFTLSQFIFAIGTDIWMLYASRFIGGIGAAFLVPPMMAYVADITTEDERGKGMGYLGAYMSLGFVIGPGIGGFLAEFGTRIPFYSSAAIATVATILSFLLLPETLSLDIQEKARHNSKKRETIFVQIYASFNKSYFIFLLLIFMMTFGLANFEAVFGLYVFEKFDFTPKDISIIITFGALVGVIIQSLVVDKVLSKFGEIRVIFWTFLISSISLLALIFAGSFTTILLITLVFFTATSLVRPALNTQLSIMAGDEQGFVAGLNNMYFSIGNMAGPIFAGILFDINIEFPYVLGSFVLLVSCFMTIKSKSTKTRFSVESS
ncbi:MAG: blt [Bacillales bacterium]|jgi:DHA1 family multidrug resistance protein-like MFS transporter|nr:blt [Bacillales bacterium]